MTPEQILQNQAMPIAAPGFGPAPYRFLNREYFIIVYESDPALIREALPEPLEPDGSNTVYYEWIEMPDSSGLGSYEESGLVIPSNFQGEACNFTAQMYLDNGPAILAGREIWGFPKKWGKPRLRVEGTETLTGTLHYNNTLVAMGTMRYKDSTTDLGATEKALSKLQINLKQIPDCQGQPKIARLIGYHLEDITVKGSWTGEAMLHLCHTLTRRWQRYLC